MGELFTGRIQSRLSNILGDNLRLQIFGRLDGDFAQAGLNKDGFTKLQPDYCSRNVNDRLINLQRENHYSFLEFSH